MTAVLLVISGNVFNLLTLTAVASNPKSSEEKIHHSRLLVNMTIQSVQQIRQRPE